MNYAALCIGLVIGLPWLGALLVWWAGDGRPRLQHTLAVLFSVAAGVAALLLIPLGSADAAVKIVGGRRLWRFHLCARWPGRLPGGGRHGGRLAGGHLLGRLHEGRGPAWAATTPWCCSSSAPWPGWC